MNAGRFDAMTRLLIGAAPSRRRLFTGVAGSAVGTVASALGLAEVRATHFGCRHVGVHCNRSGQCCSGRCRGPKGKKRCRAHDVGMCKPGQDSCEVVGDFPCGDNSPNGSCVCFVTTGGASFCGGNNEVIACTKDKQCEASHGTGAACVRCAGDTICVSKCPNPD